MALRLVVRRPRADPSAVGSRFVLQIVQPALLGFTDGAVSTLAPLFATAELTGRPWAAFVVGMAASLGAGLSMGLAEALSDDGRVTGRGPPWLRGAVTGGATVLGGTLHALPFLLPHLGLALALASAIVGLELVTIAWVRHRYMGSPLGPTVLQVLVGGALVFLVGLAMGRWGGH